VPMMKSVDVGFLNVLNVSVLYMFVNVKCR
jgi:hypothetical protein